MFMRISWGRVQPGQWTAYEEAFRRFGRLDVEGLLARWLVRDAGDPDCLFAITLWETAEAIKEWEASREYIETYRPSTSRHLLGSYSISVCEVRHASAKDAGLLARLLSDGQVSR